GAEPPFSYVTASPTSSGARRVDRLLQDLARLERQYAPAGDDDLRSRLRVSSLARTFGVHDEVAEPRDLHLLAPLQMALDHLEDRLDHFGGLFFREAVFLDPLVDPFDDLCLGHRHGITCKPAGLYPRSSTPSSRVTRSIRL